ncbi:RagB/SusD family nutrient uptake outer membrane protein [Tunicatimonas pelagia]|uniref:RagB/SusD family nutrient uptake outer membrane protein n=1 Tax=Tunicatimonas pelagia TaxID=931531 RepID=UPI0026657F3F|nr:RagB/SusD family nutrient uptake outer membrane protein [Tunicatimonas pelagia]WKN44403.1 RagB/SusD family nutrient uptake outer membrane protein [Tunicatimonas pelagia]
MKRNSLQSTVNSPRSLCSILWTIDYRLWTIDYRLWTIDYRLWTIDYRLWTIGLLTILLTGCDDYLDENPDNRVELDNLEKAAQLLTNSYSEAAYNVMNEWMGDQVSYTNGTRKRQNELRIYAWEEVNAEPTNQDTPEFFWSVTYNAIAHANEVLAVIDQLPGDEARRRAVRGEALLARAYGHFMLINLFAKHYDQQTASTDLGIPYVTVPETEFIQTYRRATVQQVYDRIEQDMLAGLELVDATFYANSGKYHFSRESALALASRFYLYKNDFENCIRYSTELLGSDPSFYVKDLADLLAQRTNTDDYIRLRTSPNQEANLLLVRQQTFIYSNVGFYPGRNFYQQMFSDNPFNADDLRRDPAFQFGGVGVDGGLLAAKFERLFQRSSLTSNVGFPYTIFVAFRGEEVLLNRAESYAQFNRIDEAIADLQVLTNHRYEGAPEVTMEIIRQSYRSPPGVPDQNLLLDYIIQQERPKEFIHEGLRWFDIKRYRLAVTHSYPDGSTATLSENDNRKALQIPEAAQEIGELRPNPR